MKFSTAIALILVALAGVTSAEPERAETSGRVGYKDGRDALQTAQGWALIATSTPAKNGTEFIMVGKEAGPIGQLRIDAHGLVIVVRMKVFFTDGTHRAFELDRRLGPHHKSALVDLDAAKPIERVVVTTENYTKGTYKIYGSSGALVAGG